MMKTRTAGQRRHLPSSPFANREAEPIEDFALDDRVTHDTYGLGRVVGCEDGVAVTVDFGARRLRIASPFPKLTKL